ncbi:MAG TPA: Fic/DOC family N-terminal domain-containing protein [Solirubrobacteraceae bacterium]|nr:Fic/DOC family N-terminal domain-containing protein [Solirubrobacteraceae bacterium]
MDLDALGQSPIGQLVPISGTDATTGRHYDYFAFLPDPLPRTLELASATWTQVAAAEAALGRLDQAAQQVPEPSLLRRPALRQEAQSTSALEGTFAPFEVVLDSEPEDRHGLTVEVREVLNYVVAAEHGFSWVRERPITVGLIERLQKTLVSDTPSQHRDAGRIREQQVIIGARGTPIESSRYVPPPQGDQLRAGMETWLDWFRNHPGDLPPVARAALAHYQFEALHPFSDGNGRIGRLLIAMQLIQDDVLREPILVVSPWFEARRTEYQDGLLELSRTGDWDAWVSFFAAGIEASADLTRATVDALFAWRARALQITKNANVSALCERIAGELIGTPIVRAPQIAKRHGVTPQGAMLALRKLVSLGLLTEGRTRGRVRFVAGDVLEVLGQ